jgi:leader peptidase (prepilin peptidase)/N-methyltransferase
VDSGVVIVAGVVGAGLGLLAPRLAALVGDPRYGEGAEGHDPEDEALAPMRSFTSRSVALGSAVVGAAGCVAITSQYLSGWVVLTLCGVLLLLLAACLVDLRYLRLPNVLTYGGALAGFVAIVAVSFGTHKDLAFRWTLGGLVGAIGYAGFLLLVSELFRLVRGKIGLGLGDVKLALPLGLSLGWIGWGSASPEPSLLGTAQYVILAAMIGNVLGAIGGLVLTRLRPNRSFPFGPFLALGWLVVLALQPIV